MQSKLKKWSLALVVCSVVLVVPDIVSAQGRILMESHEPIEYPYRKTTVTKKSQSLHENYAHSEVIAHLNMMSNVSDFESATSSEVKRTLEAQFQSIGPILSGGIMVGDDSSASSMISSSHRGLIVTIKKIGFSEFDPGTTVTSKSLHNYGARSTLAWGTFLYTFKVYAPAGFDLVAFDPNRPISGTEFQAPRTWSNRIDEFGITPDGRLTTRTRHSGSNWSGWSSLGGKFELTQPKVASWGSGRYDGFGVGADGQLWQFYYDVDQSSQWQWTPLGGLITEVVSAVNFGSEIWVTVIGVDGSQWICAWDGNSWSWFPA